MRTKTLLLTVAVLAVGISASMAQVYSVNAVGYVNVTVRPGYNLISNPLNGTNNLINTVIPTAPDGTTAFGWDSTSQQFAQADSYINGLGWVDGNFETSATVLAPGKAFFVQNNSGSQATLTFVGEVPQGSLTNRIGGNYGFYASIVPQSASLTVLGFPGQEGMNYNGWDAVNQTYAQAYSYFGGAWYDGNFVEGAPIPAVAEGFLITNPGGAVDWTRTFTVNN